MSRMIMNKRVRRVIVLGNTEEGDDRQLVYKKKKKKRKKRRLKSGERFMRRLAEAEQRGTGRYLERHRRSGRKKKDGAMKDLGKNMRKAVKKGGKRLKFKKIFKF